MEGRCEKHPFERMERHCRACGGEFCDECLVYSYGQRKPPYCVNCALSAAGVRSTAARPQLRSKRDIKRETKEAKRKAKLAAKTTVEIDARELLDTQPLGPTGRDTVRFEFAINEDGSIEQEPDAVPVPATVPAAVPEDAPTAEPAARSIFDYSPHE
jgi:hypothetical protein